MSVSINSGCQKCGRLVTVPLVEDKNGKIIVICSACREKYYSPKAIREAKLNRILHEPWYKRLFNLFK